MNLSSDPNYQAKSKTIDYNYNSIESNKNDDLNHLKDEERKDTPFKL
jgi:hypothetical protein